MYITCTFLLVIFVNILSVADVHCRGSLNAFFAYDRDVNRPAAPKIYLPNKRIVQVKGKETILECEVIAFPHADVYWEKDGQKITTRSRKHRLEMYEEEGDRLTLTLRVLDIAETDYGLYTCIASNTIGKDAESMFLYELTRRRHNSKTRATTVSTTARTTPITKSKTSLIASSNAYPTRRPEPGSRPEGHRATQRTRYGQSAAPKIYLPNKRIVQVKGKETILECEVIAFPHADVYWEKDGQKITTRSRKHRLELYEEEGDRLTLSLRVFDIAETDYGRYTCIASNTIGKDADSMFLYELTRRRHNSKTSATTVSTSARTMPITESPTSRITSSISYPTRRPEPGSRPESHPATQRTLGGQSGSLSRSFEHDRDVNRPAAPKIYLPNKRIGQVKGKETILECTVIAFLHADVYWEKDGQKITTRSRKHRLEMYEEEGDHLTLTLRVFDIAETDYGRYTCIASNTNGKDAESMFLYELTRRRHNSKTSATTVSTTARTMPITASPASLISSSISYPTRRPEPGSRPELHRTIQRTRDGQSAAPKIYLPNKRIVQVKGKETILECTVIAFPHADVYWEKDGQKITTRSRKHRLEMYTEEADRLTLTLRVFDIVETDFGRYTCIASNTIGKDADSMFLYEVTRRRYKTSATTVSTTARTMPITESPTSLITSSISYPTRRPEPGSRPESHPATQRTLDGQSAAPNIYLPNKRIGQVKGKETILECTVIAFPHADVYWEKDGQKITTRSRKHRLEMYEEEGDRLTLTLRVFDIAETDYGLYTCVASNAFGKDAESMFLYEVTRRRHNSKTSATTVSTTARTMPITESPTSRISSRKAYLTRRPQPGSRREGHRTIQRTRDGQSGTAGILTGKSKEANSAGGLMSNLMTMMFLPLRKRSSIMSLNMDNL